MALHTKWKIWASLSYIVLSYIKKTISVIAILFPNIFPGSFDYEDAGYQESSLTKIDILLNDKEVIYFLKKLEIF